MTTPPPERRTWSDEIPEESEINGDLKHNNRRLNIDFKQWRDALLEFFESASFAIKWNYFKEMFESNVLDLIVWITSRKVFYIWHRTMDDEKRWSNAGQTSQIHSLATK